MATLNGRVLVLLAGAVFATSACGANTAVPTGMSQIAAPDLRPIGAVDSTSILKKLTKDVKIGSTVDPKNGDMGPRSLSLVHSTFGLKRGQLLVCNYEDAQGTPGNGTTIEVLNPTPNSKPKTFVQDSKLKGCDGVSITNGNVIYGAGENSHTVVQYNQSGDVDYTYGKPIVAPFDTADAFCGFAYAPEDIYVPDAKTGAVVKLEFLPVSKAKDTEMQVISGFAVNHGSGWSGLGPSGIQYNGTHIGTLCNDTLYIVDGVDNTIVAVWPASSLLEKNEIVIQKGGKTFKCLQPKKVCAKLLYSGSPLDAPVASALLPNGNLVVANTKGGNKLVEISAAGKVLATKTVDTSSTPHIFGLQASGTDDSDTVLYYTDTATNTLQELEQ